tara:strand:+ start:486 stop:1187 length:702 start_codon:yes stop_codon:yes gene_type:complete
MAVEINDVYQKVQVIANKEQRGYITPVEFNSLANQVQNDIFEQYFYDLNQADRKLETYEEYSNAIDLIKEKISPFHYFKSSPSATSGNTMTLATSTYMLGDVYYTASGIDYVVEPISKEELTNIQLSPLATPSIKRPVYVRKSATQIEVFPTTLTMGLLSHDYVKKPTTVVLGYNTATGAYDSSTTTNFELHPSEEANIVIKILQLIGIIIKDPGLYQISSQEEIKDLQQEKA